MPYLGVLNEILSKDTRLNNWTMIQEVNHKAISSLENKIVAVNDPKERLDLLLSLSDELREIDAAKSMSYAQEALDIAQTLTTHKEEGIAERLIAFCLVRQNKYDEAIPHIEKAVDIFTNKVQDLKEMYYAQSVFAKLHLYLGNLPQANKYFTETLELAEQLDQTDLILISCASLALVAHRQGNISKAKLYVIKGLARDDEAGTRDHAYLYNAVGIVYAHQKIFDTSIHYYHKALKIWETIGTNNFSAYALNNIGIIYKHKKQYEKALEYYQKALSNFLKAGDQVNAALTYHNIGEAYALMERFKDAHIYFEKALEISKITQDKFQMGLVYFQIAQAYFNEKAAPQIIKKYLDKVVKLSKEIDNKELSRQAFELYSKLHLYEKDISQAVKYQSKFIEANEAIHDKDIKEIQKTQEVLIKQIEDIHQENNEMKGHFSKLENLLEKTLNQVQDLNKKLS